MTPERIAGGSFGAGVSLASLIASFGDAAPYWAGLLLCVAGITFMASALYGAPDSDYREGASNESGQDQSHSQVDK